MPRNFGIHYDEPMRPPQDMLNVDVARALIAPGAALLAFPLLLMIAVGQSDVRLKIEPQLGLTVSSGYSLQDRVHQ